MEVENVADGAPPAAAESAEDESESPSHREVIRDTASRKPVHSTTDGDSTEDEAKTDWAGFFSTDNSF